ncbi:ABC transporter ATP-binding protein, partial [Klebsiella pneumoniae]|uniref:ATP-binding cassette domain-containing protein n=1 Tax=Klebsiella pneumoniae TaxID=573 RepID=UPI002778B800|nr:ABC transporter ATP-binding protein [Klebsiella pneumoniae]
LAGTMSGGEQQMLASARARMSEPVVLMLDEPSLGLAPKIVGERFGLRKPRRAETMTVLRVEQNATAALAIADRAYV